MMFAHALVGDFSVLMSKFRTLYEITRSFSDTLIQIVILTTC